MELKSPPGYNFGEVFTEKLDIKLKEISGLAWDSKNNVFLAVNDEVGKLFILDKETKSILTEYTFGDNGDYEDVAIMNGITYVLRSDGLIIRIVREASGKVYGVVAGKISLSGSNDFETMYGDTARKALIIICKNCKSDNADIVSAYAFYPDSIGFDNKTLYTINTKKVEELSPFKTSKKLQPSAAAIHPVSKKLFILSSASHQLVIADLNGNVESVFKLTTSLFPQPEGIAFKQNGDMYISNEMVSGKSTLLKFLYNSPADTKEDIIKKVGYNFTVPDDKMELGKQLHEISGMAYIPQSNLILAENDEKGTIYTVDFIAKNGEAGKLKFAGKGDYEDIVYTDTAVYMLVSSGTVVEVLTKDSSFSTKEFELPLKGKNEFETLYLDPDGHSLIMLCKDCDGEKDKMRAAYRFDLNTQTFSPAPYYVISIKDIRKTINDDKVDFKPSGAAINPITGKLFIIASVGKILVVTDDKGKVEQVVRLDGALFNQPEGITFAPYGDLYISNEGGNGVATILKFEYKK
jgi:uncharacterized protein YjiK